MSAVSAGAASTKVFTQNNLTYGMYPPASKYTENSIKAIADAAVDAAEVATLTVQCASGLDVACGTLSREAEAQAQRETEAAERRAREAASPCAHPLPPWPSPPTLGT